MLKLSKQQDAVLERFYLGKNIFITGSAGTGKSFLIQKMCQGSGLSVGNGGKIQVCAMTGIAAVLLNSGSCNFIKARTIHSWSGIKLCNNPDKRVIINRVLKNKRVHKDWKQVSILIIDEISMMSCYVFEILEELARIIRKNNKPFGGIQVIFTGDMFQLPPIGDLDIPNSCKFCFESEKWNTVFEPENHIELIHIYRQNDPIYINLLNQIRLGEIDETNREILFKRVGLDTTGLVLTKLFPIRVNVDRINQFEFAKIDETEHVFNQMVKTDVKFDIDTGKPFDEETLRICENATIEEIEQEKEMLKSQMSTVCQERVLLKKGAVVMCVANLDIDLGICNGSQGRIIDILSGTKRKIYCGGTTGTATTNPVATIETSMDIPIVEFTNGVVYKSFVPQLWQSQNLPCIVIGQIPLVLSWATTIHKSQGMTLSRAEMDLGSQVFEYGQAYVALSRVKSLEGLYLTNFNPNKIKANPKVIAFYKKIKEYMTENLILEEQNNDIAGKEIL